MDDARARDLLNQERRRINDELSHLGLSPNDDLSTTDLADEATDLYFEEVDASRLDDLREQLAAVERAEERLADGTHGRPAGSGATSPPQPLAALPPAERTVDEEARGEGGG